MAFYQSDIYLINMKSFVILIFLVMALVNNIDSSSETMKRVTIGFMNAFKECKEELQMKDNIMVDLYHYWKEDHDIQNREFGCAIICMSKKLDLIDDSGKIRHGNAHEFAKLHGADSSTAAKLVEQLHFCEKSSDTIEDDCSRVLQVAKCFRAKVHELNWAPDVKVILEEVLIDI